MSSAVNRSVKHWYVSNGKEQSGPFSATEIFERLWAGRLSSTQWLTREGQSYATGTVETNFSILVRQYADESIARGARRVGLPRFSLKADILVNTNGRLLFGELVDLSDKGLFFFLGKDLFATGDTFSVMINSPLLTGPVTLDIQIKRKDVTTSRFGYGCSITAFRGAAAAHVQAFLLTMIVGSRALAA